MNATSFPSFVSATDADVAVILGTNEIASALAVKLRKDGYHVILSHEPCPPVLRRGMAFADALHDDECELEGVRARRAEDAVHLAEIAAEDACVAVTPLQLSDLLALRRIQVLIDARLKPSAATPDYRHYVGLSVGLGRHFNVGENCDLALEAAPTHCGAIHHCVARQPCQSAVARDDPAFAVAPARGVWHTALEIGDPVRRGDLLGRIGDASVRARLDGVLVGLARDGLVLPEGSPVAEVAPDAAHACRGLDPDAKRLAATAFAAINGTEKQGFKPVPHPR
jgi:xanthine dehydrogenase accessory factor